MISEVVFAREFSSFWRVATPTMEGFVRRLNSGLYDRDYGPLRAATAANRRSFVNEVAFELFCIRASVSESGESRPSLTESLDLAVAIVRKANVLMSRDGDYVTGLTQFERDDVAEQVHRLSQRLAASSTRSIVVKPAFPGCGIVDTCHGDVLAGDILFEVKAGDRPFRSIDVRQLLTYLALNYMSRRYVIRSVGLVNPRVGVSVEMATGELCYGASGRDVPDLLEAIAYGISSGEISR